MSNLLSPPGIPWPRVGNHKGPSWEDAELATEWTEDDLCEKSSPSRDVEESGWEAQARGMRGWFRKD